MFLEIEPMGKNRRLINTTLVDKVELDDANKIAGLWIGGTFIVDSKAAYEFYTRRPAELIAKVPEKPKPLQVGQE